MRWARASGLQAIARVKGVGKGEVCGQNQFLHPSLLFQGSARSARGGQGQKGGGQSQG